MAFDWRAEKARVEHFKSADYRRFLTILENTRTDREAAALLGVSPRTISRWKSHGIPAQALSRRHDDLVRLAANARRRQKRAERTAFLRDEAPRIRPVVTSRHAGEMVHVYMPGASFEQYWKIIKKFQSSVYPYYVGYYFTIRFNSKFSGWWDGQETTKINMGISYRIEQGGTTMNTKLASTDADLHGDDDDILNTLNRYFYMKEGHIEKLVFIRMNLEGHE